MPVPPRHQQKQVVGRLSSMNSMARALPVPPVNRSAERLAELFDTHYDRLYCLARRLVPTVEHAQDLVQDTFFRAARSLASVPHGTTEEEAWLVRVLVNIRRDEWRKAAVRQRHEHTIHPAESTRDHEAAFVARTTVWRALESLPPRRRAVVVMHELEGLPIATIASLLGITAVTARWHVAKGRRDLARILRVQVEGAHENH